MGDTDDYLPDYLLQLLGALDARAPETNFSSALKAKNWRAGFADSEVGTLAQAGRDLCLKLGIDISRGYQVQPTSFAPVIRNVSLLPGSVGPPFDVKPPVTGPSSQRLKTGRP